MWIGRSFGAPKVRHTRSTNPVGFGTALGRGETIVPAGRARSCRHMGLGGVEPYRGTHRRPKKHSAKAAG